MRLATTKRFRAAVCAALVAMTLGLTAPAHATPGASGGTAITVVSRTHLDSRLLKYQLRTPALDKTTPLRVLLPTGYSSHPNRRYPVLYLLHGCCNRDVPGAASWTEHGDIERLTAHLPLIVVMPDDGLGGFYSDWYDPEHEGKPRWETYTVDQLIPWVDTHFRSSARRDHRAVAGVSMGGFGSMSLAARHPDRFVFAASFSGAVDNHGTLGAFQLVDNVVALQDGGLPWGPYATESIRWKGHNAVDLATNLRSLRLELRTGNGLPGGAYGGGHDPIEMIVHRENLALHRELQHVAIPHVWDDYGPGSHSWPYWNRDLRRTLPDMMATFRAPPARPQQITYRTIEDQYRIFGWKVSMTRPALEFSTLSHADRGGFTLAGSGSAMVTTPPVLPPGHAATVTLSTRSGTSTVQLRADEHGKLTIAVPLGPGNPIQQGRPGARTKVYHTRVDISSGEH